MTDFFKVWEVTCHECGAMWVEYEVHRTAANDEVLTPDITVFGQDKACACGMPRGNVAIDLDGDIYLSDEVPA
jgi:hypothetical protein